MEHGKYLVNHKVKWQGIMVLGFSELVLQETSLL